MSTDETTTDYRGKVRARDRETSWEAASRQTDGKREQIQRRIYATLEQYGPMTDEQLWLAIGSDQYGVRRADGREVFSKTTPSSVRTRRHELELLGWVTATDERRPTLAGSPAVVWRAVLDGEPAPAPRPKRRGKTPQQPTEAVLVRDTTPQREGLAAARRWAEWNLGDPAQADAIVRAYLDAQTVNAELDAEGAPA
jgi:hypothetical protein